MSAQGRSSGGRGRVLFFDLGGRRQSRIPQFTREGLPKANSLSIALTRARYVIVTIENANILDRNLHAFLKWNRKIDCVDLHKKNESGQEAGKNTTLRWSNRSTRQLRRNASEQKCRRFELGTARNSVAALLIGISAVHPAATFVGKIPQMMHQTNNARARPCVAEPPPRIQTNC